MGWFDFLCPIVLGDAEIRVLSPAGGRALRVRFILKTFALAKTNEFAEISVPGLNGQPVQFVRGRTRMLSAVLYFDGRATSTDVREPMAQVRSLMQIDRHTHTPPLLSFEWSSSSFQCVLESVVEQFSSSFPDGRPSRGRLHTTFRESLTLEQLQQEAGRQ